MSRASAPAAAAVAGSGAGGGASASASASASSYRMAMSGGDEEEGTTWMQPMTRSWEEITEDSAGGGLSAGGGQLAAQRERKARLRAASLAQGGGEGAVRAVIEKGVIRYLFVVLDFSWCSGQNDLKVRGKWRPLRARGRCWLAARLLLQCVALCGQWRQTVAWCEFHARAHV